MINRVVLVGRIAKDLDLKYTPSGVAMCRFTLAVNRTFSNQSGEREADFISCVAFRKTAESLANHMSKGSLIGLTGRIQTGSYMDQQNKKVYTTDIVADEISFLEPKRQGQQNQQQNQNSSSSGNNGSYSQTEQSYNQPPQYTQPNYNQSQGQSTMQNQQYQNPQNFGNDAYRQPMEVSEDDLPF